MKRFWGIIIAVVGVLVAMWMVARRGQTQTLEAQREASLARIQRDYLERVGWVRVNPDERTFTEDANALFRWYFKEIGEHVKRFDGNPAFDGYLTELEQREGKDPQIAEKKAVYESVKRTFDLFRRGGYVPQWSSTDKGMRLDVVSGEVRADMGDPKIRLPVVLWGAPRELKDGGGPQSRKKMVASARFSMSSKLYDANGKLFGEMNLEGGPSMKVEWPERYIPEFPPQMVLGHFDLDLIPADVTKIELTFNVSSTPPMGSSYNAQYVWKLDAPPAWKLKTGQKWENAQDVAREPEPR